MTESLRSRDDLKEVLETARGLIAQEFQITERLDGKARNQASLAGAWFAAVQVAAGLALGVPHLGWEWLAPIIGLAAVAALSFAGLLFVSREVWGIRHEDELAPSEFETMLRDAEDPEKDVLRNLIRQAAWILRSRRQRNSQRAAALEKAEWVWLGTLAVGLMELLMAFVARAVG